MEIEIQSALDEPTQEKTVWEDPVPIIKHSDTEYYCYILEEIAEPIYYGKLTHILYTLPSDTTLHMFLNTPGGNLDTVLQLCGAMKLSQCTVHVHLSGNVASGGTFLTMYANKLSVAENTSFLIHNYSGGVVGKGSEIKAQHEFSEKYMPEMFYSIYEGFLTKDEIKDIVENDKDKWMSTKEILTRWPFTTKEKKCLN